MEKNEFIFPVLIATALILLIAALLLFFFIRQRNKANEYLLRLNEIRRLKIEDENASLRKERSRIAQDLHDELGPLISSVKMRVIMIEAKSSEDQEAIRKSTEYLDDILIKIRQITHNLKSIPLLDYGLDYAIEDFIKNNIERTSKMKIIFKYEKFLTIPTEKAENLYKIVLEIIHNTIKHADATKLDIELTAKSNKILLASKDDGIGFDTGTVKKGNGLRNIARRAESLGGEFSISTSKTLGTKYLIEIPIN